MHDNLASLYEFPAINFTARLDNIGNSLESAEPIVSGAFMGATLWARFIAPSTATYTVHTFGSAIDTVLTLFRSTLSSGMPGPVTDFADLEDIGFNDDAPGSGGSQSKVTVALTAGDDIYIQVGGFDSPPPAEGQIQLTVADGDTSAKFLPFIPVQSVTVAQ